MSEPTYMIVRHFFNQDRRVIRRGLTLEEAKEHCEDPQTSSRTCTTADGVRLTKEYGPWFDGFTEE